MWTRGKTWVVLKLNHTRGLLSEREKGPKERLSMRETPRNPIGWRQNWEEKWHPQQRILRGTSKGTCQRKRLHRCICQTHGTMMVQTVPAREDRPFPSPLSQAQAGGCWRQGRGGAMRGRQQSLTLLGLKALSRLAWGGDSLSVERSSDWTGQSNFWSKTVQVIERDQKSFETCRRFHPRAGKGQIQRVGLKQMWEKGTVALLLH